MRALIMQAIDNRNAEANMELQKRLMQLAIVILGIVLYTLVIYRAADAKAEKKFEEWRERYVNEYIEQEEAKKAGMPVDPYSAQLDYEATELAKVLYGVKDNSTADLITACWCVFNRVDNPDYPDMIEDVIAQPGQWMRYKNTNPVLDNLYKIARKQLDIWHSSNTRPCGSEYVYMNWSPVRITLRDNWQDGSSTNYWRWVEE